MIGSGPLVSVVIPTHNRRAVLARTLDALGAQTYAAQRTEVLVVADGCVDDTTSMLRQRTRDPFGLHVFEQRAAGAAAARNRGAEQAVGQVLLFLDDDIEADPRLIEHHVAQHHLSDDTKRVVMGYSKPVFDAHCGLYGAGLRSWWEAHFHAMRQPGYRFTFQDLLSGNFSLASKLFAELGGFDRAFDGACREDYDLGIRLLAAGATFAFASEALGYHHEQADVEHAVQRKYQEGKADVRLGTRHPSVRQMLPLANPGPGRSLSRRLAFARPHAGDGFMRGLRHGLRPLERLRLRYGWRTLFWLLLDYWYWRGVAEELGTLRAVVSFVEEGLAMTETEQSPLELDLRRGLSVAEQRIDAERPAGVVLHYGGEPIGCIPARFGAEPVRSQHLRRALATEFADRLLTALALDQVACAPDEPTRFVAQRAGGSRPLSKAARRKHSPPIKVVARELSEVLSPIRGVEGYAEVRVLVRNQGRPIGWVAMPNLHGALVTAPQLRAGVASQLGRGVLRVALGQSLRAQGSVAPVPLAVPVSVVVCTRDRPGQLSHCLEAILRLDYPREEHEVVVVDNAPSDSRTAELASRFGVRYVREDRPGLDWARNRGIAAAAFDVIAFTDDDARPDPGWLRAIVDAFAEPSVAAVTGFVAPLELETEPQVQFELGYGGMGHGFRRRVIRRTADTATGQLLWASGFGVGANMAFRREVFAAVGPFDVALDLGTPSRGGGDVEMFHRLVANGHTLVYDPSALVWHTHRRDRASLRRLVFANGQGFGAYLLTCARNRTMGRFAILRFAAFRWFGGWLLPHLWRCRATGFPRHLVLLELLGAISSPLGYRAAQARARHLTELTCDTSA